jgi:hypothetical protein
MDFTAETPTASTVPEPFGKPSGPGLWHVKGMELPAYVQHVAHALLNNGHAATIGQAIGMAKGIIADWEKGHLPGHKHYKVHADVRAAAATADAEWQAKRAKAHATVEHDHTRGGGMEVDLTTPHPIGVVQHFDCSGVVDLAKRSGVQASGVTHARVAADAASGAAARAATASGKSSKGAADDASIDAYDASKSAAKAAKTQREAANDASIDAYDASKTVKQLQTHLVTQHAVKPDATALGQTKSDLSKLHQQAHATGITRASHPAGHATLKSHHAGGRGSASFSNPVGGIMNGVSNEVDLAGGDGYKSLGDNGGTAKQLADTYDDREATLGPDHPHTKKAKAALDEHLKGRGASKGALVEHMMNVHNMPEDQSSDTLANLEGMHGKKFPGCTWPKRKRGAESVSMSRDYGVQQHFNASGARIDLAMTAAVATKGHRHRSRYSTDSDVVSEHEAKDEKHPTLMTPDQLRTHLADKHGMSVSSQGASTIQDVDATRKMHAALHPNSYDLSTTTVMYPTGTKVHHHSKDNGPDHTTHVGKNGKAKDAKKKSGTYVGFDKLVARLIKQGKTPEEAKAIAASIGRKKYGAKNFAAAATKSRKMGAE